MEGRKKVHPSSSHTVENASSTRVVTTRMRPNPARARVFPLFSLSVSGLYRDGLGCRNAVALAVRTQHQVSALCSYRGRPVGRDKVAMYLAIATSTEICQLGFLLGSGDPLTREHSWADQGLLSRASMFKKTRAMLATWSDEDEEEQEESGSNEEEVTCLMARNEEDNEMFKNPSSERYLKDVHYFGINLKIKEKSFKLVKWILPDTGLVLNVDGAIWWLRCVPCAMVFIWRLNMVLYINLQCLVLTRTSRNTDGAQRGPVHVCGRTGHNASGSELLSEVLGFQRLEDQALGSEVDASAVSWSSWTSSPFLDFLRQSCNFLAFSDIPTSSWLSGTYLPFYGFLGHSCHFLAFSDIPAVFWLFETFLSVPDFLGHPCRFLAFWDIPTIFWLSGMFLPFFGFLGRSCHFLAFSNIPAISWLFRASLASGVSPGSTQQSACLFREMMWVPLHRVVPAAFLP
ncbi:hypothetical protein Taro_036948 [Colocasia esculenta]|uniref:Uncharacterized protein n=1 Tax=Colocasia esculenta TaxID=4460 RepID=A0A843WHT1_COLES|nr:hypothetical protein [Colocasia esculenta]